MKDRVRVLKQFNMDLLPRSVGNPRQHIVTKGNQFLKWIERTDGQSTCYTSHNSYPSLTEDGDPEKVKVKNIFLDFDKDEGEGVGFSKVARDARLVSEYLKEQDIKHTVSFSGRAGYHIYLHTKPTVETINNGLSMKYRGIYAHLKKELNLMSLDQRCAEPKRLCRIPGTIYTKKDTYTDRKCYPIPAEESIPKKQEEMYERSKGDIPKDDLVRGYKTLTIGELMDEWDIEPGEMDDEELFEFTDYKPPKTEFLELAGEFFRPCIRNMLFTKNPPHFVRMASCIKLKIIFPLQKAINFYDTLSSEVGWVDRPNKKKRDYNIRHIYSRNYKLPRCKKIKQEGYCVGKKCKYYHDIGEEDAKDYN